MMLLAAAFVGLFVAFAGWLLLDDTNGSSRPRATHDQVVVVSWSLISFVVGFTVFRIVTGTASLAIPLGVACMAIPRMIVNRRRKLASRRMLDTWPDALRSVRSSLLAGRSLHTGLIELGRNGPTLLQPMLRRYERLSTTLDQAQALDVIRTEAEDPFVDRIIEVLIAASDAGPATVLDIIDDLADAAIDDLQLRARVETAALEQKLNAGVIMSVPILLLFLMNAAAPLYRDFYSQPIGFVVFGIGMTVSIGGMAVVRRLAAIPSEPRVFAGSGVAS